MLKPNEWRFYTNQLDSANRVVNGISRGGASFASGDADIARSREFWEKIAKDASAEDKKKIYQFLEDLDDAWEDYKNQVNDGIQKADEPYNPGADFDTDNDDPGYDDERKRPPPRLRNLRRHLRLRRYLRLRRHLRYHQLNRSLRYR